MRYLRHFVAVAGLVIASAGLGTAIEAQATEHCPDGGVKTEVSDSFGPTVTLEPDTRFCVKASTYATDILVMGESGTWTTPTSWHPNGTASPDISYYVVYPPIVEEPVLPPPPPVDPPPVDPPPVDPPALPEPPVTPDVPVPPEVLPPPGTPEVVVPEPEVVVPEPEVVVPEPEVEALPVVPTPTPTQLPHTGAATLAMTLLASALVGTGFGLRRIGTKR